MVAKDIRSIGILMSKEESVELYIVNNKYYICNENNAYGPYILAIRPVCLRLFICVDTMYKCNLINDTGQIIYSAPMIQFQSYIFDNYVKLDKAYGDKEAYRLCTYAKNESKLIEYSSPSKYGDTAYIVIRMHLGYNIIKCGVYDYENRRWLLSSSYGNITLKSHGIVIETIENEKDKITKFYAIRHNSLKLLTTLKGIEYDVDVIDERIFKIGREILYETTDGSIQNVTPFMTGTIINLFKVGDSSWYCIKYISKAYYRGLMINTSTNEIYDIDLEKYALYIDMSLSAVFVSCGASYLESDKGNKGVFLIKDISLDKLRLNGLKIEGVINSLSSNTFLLNIGLSKE